MPVNVVNRPAVVKAPEKDNGGNLRVILVGFGAVPNGTIVAGRAFEPVFVIALKKADDDILPLRFFLRYGTVCAGPIENLLKSLR